MYRYITDLTECDGCWHVVYVCWCSDVIFLTQGISICLRMTAAHIKHVCFHQRPSHTNVPDGGLDWETRALSICGPQSWTCLHCLHCLHCRFHSTKWHYLQGHRSPGCQPSCSLQWQTCVGLMYELSFFFLKFGVGCLTILRMPMMFMSGSLKGGERSLLMKGHYFCFRSAPS